MKTTSRAILLTSAVMAAGLVWTSLHAVESVGPVPDASSRAHPIIVVLDCAHDWSASAQGQIGGVGFALSCRNGRDKQRLVGAVGTSWSVRIGAEGEVALDCFLTGDQIPVNQMCDGAARFIIH